MFRLRQFRHLSRARQRLLFEAAFFLLNAWLLVRMVPFRWWSRWLGDCVSGEVDPDDVTFDTRTRDVAWAVIAINRRTGGRLTCLMQAMAAQRMFNRRRISSSLVFGTHTECRENQYLVMKAHAWIRVGDRVVLGHHGGQFIPLSSFIRQYQ